MEMLPVRVTQEENREKAKGMIPNKNEAAKMHHQKEVNGVRVQTLQVGLE